MPAKFATVSSTYFVAKAKARVVKSSTFETQDPPSGCRHLILKATRDRHRAALPQHALPLGVERSSVRQLEPRAPRLLQLGHAKCCGCSCWRPPLPFLHQRMPPGVRSEVLLAGAVRRPGGGARPPPAGVRRAQPRQRGLRRLGAPPVLPARHVPVPPAAGASQPPRGVDVHLSVPNQK